MVILLVDSNALRDSGLRDYLQSSRNHAVAFSDLTLIEMWKRNALQTSRESLRIVSQFPSQRFILRRTHELLMENITAPTQLARLFDVEEALQLDSLCQALQTIPPPHGLAEEMAKNERSSKLLLERLTQEVAHLEPGMIDAAKGFTSEELTQIRTQQDVTDVTRDKLFALLKETIGTFILRNQEPRRRAPMRIVDTFGMFSFRYSLCTQLYYMEWVRTGRTQKKLSRRVNDVVDMQIVALATYFNGVLTSDVNLRAISSSARGLLRAFGAYVGDDWPPATSSHSDAR